MHRSPCRRVGIGRTAAAPYPPRSYKLGWAGGQTHNNGHRSQVQCEQRPRDPWETRTPGSPHPRRHERHTTYKRGTGAPKEAVHTTGYPCASAYPRKARCMTPPSVSIPRSGGTPGRYVNRVRIYEFTNERIIIRRASAPDYAATQGSPLRWCPRTTLPTGTITRVALVNLREGVTCHWLSMARGGDRSQ